ncbi:hypothetical protein NTGM5_180098 [Candidatus Nitrotoga sp. M5]|nr:hypothetical protein NTGM5_180098 [Candidatus Nitrotoga sp. M5]
MEGLYSSHAGLGSDHWWLDANSLLGVVTAKDINQWKKLQISLKHSCLWSY